MKIIFALLLGCNISFVAFSQNPDAILGKWISTTGNCIVEVYKLKSEYKARLLWFKDGTNEISDYTDKKNPDPALRSRKLVGMEVVNGLHYDADEKEWVDGHIYDASSGKEWDSVAWITDDNLLKVKGYWMFKFLSETKTFKRD